jgi:nicotinamide phosphoribosyltransferase
MSALHQKDSYKVNHKDQYAAGTTKIYSNFTARSGKNQNVPTDGICFVGLQHFILDYLIEDWDYSFFTRSIDRVVNSYQRRVSNIVGYKVNVDHIRALHKLGYLPIEIKALPEGSMVPYGVPMLTVVNTKPEFFWVTNMLESVLSAELWQPITSATTYMAYKKLGLRYAELTGADKEFVRYQFHDFGFRGMAGRHAAASSGFAVLAAGAYGTDNIPAIDLAEDYYFADSDTEIVGVSVPATEHSVMCSGTKEDEFETYKRLITEIYPSGMVSIVSDTWDFWQVITDYLVRLKSDIMARDGRVIIRPDSGDPVEILCGIDIPFVPARYVAIDCLDSIKNYMLNDIESEIRNDTPHGERGEDIVTRIYKAGDKYYKAKVEIEWNRYDKQYYYIDNSSVLEFEEVELSPEQKGLIECLWDIFGGTLTEKGYKVLDTHIGAIYGDSITYKRAEEIFRRLEQKDFASSNVVLGIGSFSFQYVTRDTHGMAMKSTYAEINGAGVEIFKDPKTDNGIKKSAKGLLMVTQTDGVYKLVDQVSVDQERHGCLETVFKDGQLIKTTTLAEIRAITDKV